jgi:hypothetical protein
VWACRAALLMHAPSSTAKRCVRAMSHSQAKRRQQHHNGIDTLGLSFPVTFTSNFKGHMDCGWGCSSRAAGRVKGTT